MSGEMSSETDEEMRWLSVQHDTLYAYDAPVELAHHVAYLSPRATDSQLVRDWSLSIDPAPDEWEELASDTGPAPATQMSFDCWGNGRLAFSHSRVHERLCVSSRFEVGLTPAAAPDPENSPAWEDVAEALRYHAGVAHAEAVEFTLPSHFAPRSPQLAAFGRLAFTPGRSVMGGALALMQLVNERMAYQPQSTSVNTRATEALALSRGVCQDFAHVMIGACRSLGLAARYVSGYLLTNPPEGQPRLIGADASHAWMAIWCPEQGWVALDPTNDVPAGMDHVTLAWGRDYGDVAPLRGVIRGGGRALPRVAVTVQPLDNALPPEEVGCGDATPPARPVPADAP